MKNLTEQLKNRWQSHVALLLSAVILCAGMVNNAVVMYFEDGICNDAVYYREMIANWIKYGSIMQSNVSDWNIFAMPPFWLWCVKNVSTWFNMDIFAAARSINFVVGSLIPLIFYYIIGIFNKDKYLAFFCAIVLSCHPTLSALTSLITRDCLYFFLVSLSILLLLRGAMRDDLCSAIWAGIPLGLSIFTRYESVELIPGALIFMIFCVWGKKLSWQRAIVLSLSSGMALVAALAVSSLGMKLPWEYHISFWGRYLNRIINFF